MVAWVGFSFYHAISFEPVSIRGHTDRPQICTAYYSYLSRWALPYPKVFVIVYLSQRKQHFLVQPAAHLLL